MMDILGVPIDDCMMVFSTISQEEIDNQNLGFDSGYLLDVRAGDWVYGEKHAEVVYSQAWVLDKFYQSTNSYDEFLYGAIFTFLEGLNFHKRVE